MRVSALVVWVIRWTRNTQIRLCSFASRNRLIDAGPTSERDSSAAQRRDVDDIIIILCVCYAMEMHADRAFGRIARHEWNYMCVCVNESRSLRDVRCIRFVLASSLKCNSQFIIIVILANATMWWSSQIKCCFWCSFDWHMRKQNDIYI